MALEYYNQQFVPICFGDSVPVLVDVSKTDSLFNYYFSIDVDPTLYTDSSYSDSLQEGLHYYTISYDNGVGPIFNCGFAGSLRN